MILPGPNASPDYSARTLRDLAVGAARGDERAFEALHRRLSPGLKRLLLTRANQRHDVVEDITQRTWTAVWQALREKRYDENKSAITTFVYAVGYKLWLQHLRKEGRAAELFKGTDAAFAAAAEASPDPASAARMAELLDAVRGCLRDEGSELSEDERWLLRSAAEGASDRDLAKELGLAPSTINARKRGAMDKVRRYLAQRGYREFPGERGGGERQ